MKTMIILLLTISYCMVGSTSQCVAFNRKDILKLWYKQPASDWNNALPIGNGSLGAMIFGGVVKERIQLNEDTVWTQRGNYVDRNGSNVIPEVRKLLFDGEYEQAEELIEEKLMNERLPSGTNTYQTLGDLTLMFDGHDNYTHYRRELDIEESVVRVAYNVEGISYQREIFSSAPDKAIVMRITTSERGRISFTAGLSRPGNLASVSCSGNEIVMTEHVGEGNGVKFEARLRIKVAGGTVSSDGAGLSVKNADEAVIFITAATDYWGDDQHEVCLDRIEKAFSQSYTGLFNIHKADYQRLFNRVSFDIGETEASWFAVDERLDALRQGSTDPSLIALYYQFGRYLLISSSRPGSLPANLQGIWCDGLIPPWNSDYHININIQMNYWPSEITNLSECHEPYIEFIGRLREKGRVTAKQTYGCRGFTAHHTTDAWGNTALFGKPVYGMWPMGAAWSCQHIMEHYLFTGDKEFLTENYPVMREAALFCVDFLVKHPEKQELVSGPSISPENTFITKRGNRAVVNMGAAMDQEIIHDLFTNCIEASTVLETDDTFRNKLMQLRDRLAPLRIGKDGRIMEWVEEFEEAEPGHRHMSHLFALHPGKQCSWQKTPELMKAVRKSIDYRLAHGGGHTGWSRAWIINFFARLKDGNKAYENVVALLTKSTLPNLFDNHPPFQIDGNFGAVAGVTEMLLQSHTGEVDLLPALPDAWDCGKINGLCARGGFEVDIHWEEGRLINVVVRSKLGNPLILRYGFKYIEMDTGRGESYTFDRNLDTM